MPEINLLQNQLKDTTLTAKKRTKLTAVISFVVLLLLIGAIVALYLMAKQIDAQTLAVTTDNLKLKNQIALEDAKLNEAKAYQAQLINIKLLLKNHIAITPFLDELAKYTYLQAQFINVDVAQDLGKIHLEGAVDSYDGLGKLLLGLSTSSNFSNVKLIAVQMSAANVYTFSIDLSVAPNLFSNQE